MKINKVFFILLILIIIFVSGLFLVKDRDLLKSIVINLVKNPTSFSQFQSNSSQSECPENFTSYNSDVYKICYPNDLHIDSINNSQTVEEKPVVQMYFKNEAKNRELFIWSNLQGGWMGTVCESKENVTVSGSSAVRYTVRKENNNSCDYIQTFATLIQETDQKTFIISLTNKTGEVDKSEYLKIESSLVIK